MVLSGVITALSIGMGCGTCCGSGVTAVLFGYLTTHACNMKQSIRAFLTFYLGKIAAVACICIASSLLGMTIMSEDGNIGSIPVHTIVNLCMIAIGIWMIIKWIKGKRHKSCSECRKCTGETEKQTLKKTFINRMSQLAFQDDIKINHFALALMGAGYGISPCAPLILMTGYAATSGVGMAFLTGSVFAAASTIVPMILLLFLTGVLSSKIHKEIPQYIDLFKLLSYVLLIILFAVDLFR